MGRWHRGKAGGRIRVGGRHTGGHSCRQPHDDLLRKTSSGTWATARDDSKIQGTCRIPRRSSGYVQDDEGRDIRAHGRSLDREGPDGDDEIGRDLQRESRRDRCVLKRKSNNKSDRSNVTRMPQMGRQRKAHAGSPTDEPIRVCRGGRAVVCDLRTAPVTNWVQAVNARTLPLPFREKRGDGLQRNEGVEGEPGRRLRIQGREY